MSIWCRAWRSFGSASPIPLRNIPASWRSRTAGSWVTPALVCSRTGAAYDWGVETTIYVKKDCKRGGIGRKLYTALEKVSAAQHILNLNACIGYPEVEDEYLTRDSAHFHEHLGYRLVGEFHKCGYKFGRWYDMIWMEKLIGDHTAEPKPVVPFPELDELTLHKCGIE